MIFLLSFRYSVLAECMDFVDFGVSVNLNPIPIRLLFINNKRSGSAPLYVE